jgi:CubicO group peptidase (beta-lactamase class C family)
VINDADLNQLAADTAAELGVAGAQIAVLHAGRLSEGVAGVASVHTGSPVTPETLFQIGSTTKVFTAAVLMALVEDRLIELDSPVVEQLPGFELSDAAALASMTPRHLMSMSSGIDNGPHTDYGSGDDALTRYVSALAELRQGFLPGDGFGYSNASTCVSGKLIEHVTGETWEQALRSRLLTPAQLHDSLALPEEIIVRSFAVGHEANGTGTPMPRDRWSLPRSMAPAGGTLCSTASDLVKFAHIFMHDGRACDGTRILDAETVDVMQRPHVRVPPTLIADWWGLGPYGKQWDGAEVLGHSGTNIGGSSCLLWSRRHSVAVATTVNTPHQGYPFADRVFRQLFGAVAGISPPPDPPPPGGDLELHARQFVGTYQMSELSLTITETGGALSLSGSCAMPGEEWHISASSLVPLSETTFRPSESIITGGRGWAIAFLGNDGEPATHLMNGLYALPRVSE